MKGFFRGMGSRAGTPPGVLGETEATRLQCETKTEVYRFFEGELTREPLEFERFQAEEPERGFSWIRVTGFRDVGTIARIGKTLSVDPLILEDCINPHQRARFEDGPNRAFVALKAIRLETVEEGRPLVVRSHCSVYAGRSFLLSFEEEPLPVVDSMVERLSGDAARPPGNVGDLMHRVLDGIVDAFFIAIERVSDRMEELEGLIVERPDPEVLSSVHSLRTQMLLFRKAVWPLREAVADLQRSDSAVLGGATSTGLFRDLYDHVLQAVDTVETLRDILSSMVDTYLSSASNRMNQTMQVLTIIATIFIPLTFVAGIYGMNFHHMPELSQSWGYPGALGLMVVITAVMLIHFRRKRWL